jgi:hypothetical protein
MLLSTRSQQQQQIGGGGRGAREEVSLDPEL